MLPKSRLHLMRDSRHIASNNNFKVHQWKRKTTAKISARHWIHKSASCRMSKQKYQPPNGIIQSPRHRKKTIYEQEKQNHSSRCDDCRSRITDIRARQRPLRTTNRTWKAHRRLMYLGIAHPWSRSFLVWKWPLSPSPCKTPGTSPTPERHAAHCWTSRWPVRHLVPDNPWAASIQGVSTLGLHYFTPIRDKIAISCMWRQIHEFSSHAIRHELYIKNRKRLFCP